MLIRRAAIQVVNLDLFTQQGVRSQIFSGKKTNHFFGPGFEIQPGPVLFYSDKDKDVSFIEVYMDEVKMTDSCVTVKWHEMEFEFAEVTV